jgi:hypothetical protein
MNELTEYLMNHLPKQLEVKPYYCVIGDTLTVYLEDVFAIAVSINEQVTVEKTKDGRIVSIKIHGIQQIIKDAQNNIL